MAYSIEIKNEVIKKISEGEKIKEISDRMGISVPTIYKWRKENQLDNKNMDDVDLAEQKETSKEIKRLIKLRKFDDALKYTDKYPDNPVIQSQKVNIYIKKRKYREAKEIGEKFRDNAPIQSQMATIAIKQGDYEKAKEIGEKFRDNAPIQSQMVTIAIKERDYEKAKEIGEKFRDDAPIQSQMATIAIKQGDYEKAREIGENFRDYTPIQSQMITIEIEEENFEKAKEIGERFKDYAPIQSQMVTIATKQGDYEKAKEIGKKFENYAPIQSQMITVAVKEDDFETVKRIGKKFLNNEVIQSQIKEIKMKDENYEKIEKEYIIEQLKEYNPFCKESKENLEFLNKIKTKLYYELEKIDLQEILQDKELTEKQKLYVALAINEKRKNVKNIKELAKKYKDSDESKNINIILQRIQSNKKQIFNWEIYDNCLGWVLDETLKNQYEQNMKKQKENEITQRKEEQRKQEIKEEKRQQERKKQNQIRKRIIEGKYNGDTDINIDGNNIQKPKVQQFLKSELKHEEKQKNNNNFKNELKVQVQQETAKIKQQNEEKQQIHIYNEVMEYLLEKRKPIYVKMQSTDLETQREGISQWDKLDDLIEKTKELKENKDYMKSIYERVTRLKEKEIDEDER